MRSSMDDGDGTGETRGLLKLAYSLDEAAEILSIGRTQIFRLVDLGEIVTFKVGKSRRVTRRQLEDFLARMEGSGGIDRLP